MLAAMYDRVMIKRVKVTTGARLHFGPLAVGAEAGRSFGGVGMMVDAPGWELLVEPAEQDEVRGGPADARIIELIGRYRRAAVCPVPPSRVTVVRAAPRHAGLGSGTQLALAIGRALSLRAGEPDVGASEIARRTERAWRSAIGTHGFECGGLLVDAGQSAAATMAELSRGSSNSNRIGALSCRVPCPDGWRFLLATPQTDAGLSGAAEQEAFRALPAMRTETTGLLCRIVLTELLPAVQGSDVRGFCEALDAFGRLVGEYFRPVQGDVYANPRMAMLAAELRTAGIRGIVQTSWGPTVAICCANEAAAVRLHASLTGEQAWHDCVFRIVRPLNAGARVIIER
jgi:beta-RFAP synthase